MDKDDDAVLVGGPPSSFDIVAAVSWALWHRATKNNGTPVARSPAVRDAINRSDDDEADVP